MHQRKSNRRQVVLIAASLSLLTLLGPPQATAQMLPGIPAMPWAPVSPRMATQQMQQECVLFTDMKVTSKMFTIAQPQLLSSKMQYEVGARMLEARVHILRALDMHDTLEMAATLNNLGWMQEHTGQMKAAEQSYLEALKNIAPGTYRGQVAVIKYNLGDMYMSEHRFIQAMYCFREALQEMRAITNPDTHAVQQIQQKYDVVRRLILADSQPSSL